MKRNTSPKPLHITNIGAKYIKRYILTDDEDEDEDKLAHCASELRTLAGNYQRSSFHAVRSEPSLLKSS